MKLIKPTLVLTVIVTLVAALLVVTYNLTYVDTSNMITEKLQKGCEEIMGSGEFAIVSDWKADGFSIEKPKNIEKLIKKSDGAIAFEIVSDGYEKKGLDLLIAMNSDGTVKDLTVISLSETPGLGTKVQNRSFLDQFKNASDAALTKNGGEIEAVTSATYSSKGVTNAVNLAIKTFKEMGGAK